MNRATRNLLSTFSVILAVLVLAVVMTGCGGSGGGSPTAPPNVTPTPTPPAVTPSISFDASTPPCGSILTPGQSVSIKVYAVVNPGEYSVSADMFDANGHVINGGGTSPVIDSSGYYYITWAPGPDHFVSTLTVLEIFQNGHRLNPPVTQTSTCGFSR